MALRSLSSLARLSTALPRVHMRVFSSHVKLAHQAQGQEEEKTTHFGFKTVPENEKQKLVGEVFHSVASKYDLMNDVMSVGVHRLWKDRFIQVMNPYPGTKLLDVAGGTGDISFRFLEHAKRNGNGDLKDTSAIVCDINSSMLEQGKARSARDSIPAHLSWVVGNAEQLPLDDDSIDCYTIAFGIRNVTHIDKALEEAFRVLRPGGRFLCLEFSQVDNPIFRKIYDTYSFEAIPMLGEIFAGDMASYKYLVESIRQFPNQTKFAGMIRNAGFRNVSYENLTMGIAAIHSGFKIV